MSTTHDPIAHAVRLLREAAQELKYAHTIGGIAEWDGTEPEVQAVYDEHMAAAEAIEEWERAVGAGGVGPLRKRDCLHQISEPSRECLQQSEALHIAMHLRQRAKLSRPGNLDTLSAAGANELERLHARITELQAAPPAPAGVAVPTGPALALEALDSAFQHLHWGNTSEAMKSVIQARAALAAAPAQAKVSQDHFAPVQEHATQLAGQGQDKP